MSVSLTRRLKRRTVNGGMPALIHRVNRAQSGPTRVKVGLPAGSAPYPDGTSVILVGAVHEFGSDDGRIPERSSIRSTTRAKGAELHRMAETIARRVIHRGGTFEEGLRTLGAYLAAEIQDAIAEGVPPPNAPSTIARKGSSKPLVDTGHLRQSITYQVERPTLAARARSLLSAIYSRIR